MSFGLFVAASKPFWEEIVQKEIMLAIAHSINKFVPCVCRDRLHLQVRSHPHGTSVRHPLINVSTTFANREMWRGGVPVSLMQEPSDFVPGGQAHESFENGSVPTQLWERMGWAEALSIRNLVCETAPHPSPEYSFFLNPKL